MVHYLDSRTSLKRFQREPIPPPKIYITSGLKIREDDIETILHPGLTVIAIRRLNFAGRSWFSSSSALSKIEVENLFYETILELPNVETLYFYCSYTKYVSRRLYRSNLQANLVKLHLTDPRPFGSKCPAIVTRGLAHAYKLEILELGGIFLGKPWLQAFNGIFNNVSLRCLQFFSRSDNDSQDVPKIFALLHHAFKNQLNLPGKFEIHVKHLSHLVSRDFALRTGASCFETRSRPPRLEISSNDIACIGTPWIVQKYIRYGGHGIQGRRVGLGNLLIASLL